VQLWALLFRDNVEAPFVILSLHDTHEKKQAIHPFIHNKREKTEGLPLPPQEKTTTSSCLGGLLFVELRGTRQNSRWFWWAKCSSSCYSFVFLIYSSLLCVLFFLSCIYIYIYQITIPPPFSSARRYSPCVLGSSWDHACLQMSLERLSRHPKTLAPISSTHTTHTLLRQNANAEAQVKQRGARTDLTQNSLITFITL
jgi:hypothetical protein